MSLSPQEQNGSTTSPPKGEAKGGMDLRTFEKKEEVQNKVMVLLDNGSSKEEIQRELDLTDKQIAPLLAHKALVDAGKKAGRTTFPAKCLPQDTKDILGLHTGDLVKLMRDEHGKWFLDSKAASDGQATMNA